MMPYRYPVSTSAWGRWLPIFVLAASCARNEQGVPVAGARPSGDAPSAEAQTAPRAVWAVAERYSYGLKLTSSLAFGDQPKAFDFDVTGKLIIAPSASEGSHATLFIILENAAIESRVPDPQRQFAAIAEQLSRFGCFVGYESGRVTEMRFSPELPTMVVSVYRQIAAALQVTVPAGNPGPFESKEYDGTGEYLAAYQRAGERTWSKHKVKYSKLLGSKAAGFMAPAFENLIPEIRTSSGEIGLSEAGRPVRVRTSDEVLIRGAQVPVHSMTTLALDADGVTQGAPVQHWTALDQKLTRLGASEAYVQTSKEQKGALDEARIGANTFESVVEKLRETTLARNARERAQAASGAGANAKREQVVETQETGQFVALTAMFRQRGDTVRKAVEKIRRDPSMANTLIDALGSSGSPAAHKALAELLTAKGADPKLSLRALGALSRSPVPSPIAVRALEDELVRDPWSTSALFGLGSYARYYRDNGDAAQETAIARVLLARLKQANDHPSRLVLGLQALANAGHRGALDTIGHHMLDRRPPVRAAAMRALQFMPGEDIDGLLANTITSDASEEVVVAALTSASAREPTDVLVRALTNTAEAASEPKARYRSIELLGHWIKTRPEVRPVIERVATNDAEEKIRTLAQSVL
jgi:hypothetical protein